MKIKKFLANDNQEALIKVKNELGVDAIILHQRKVKQKGLLGFFKKPLIEVVAAREENSDRIERSIPRKAKPLEYKTSVEELQNKIIHIKDETRNIEEKTITEEVTQIKTMLNTILYKMNKQELPDLIKAIENTDVSEIFNNLSKQGLNDELIEEIFEKYLSLKNEMSINHSELEIAKKAINSIIEKYLTSENNVENSKIMFFIGPTGVGKTTTIAKLAAHYTLMEGKTVGLISADTYRIAAVEQLKVYSDILNLPLEVIYKPAEIHFAIEKLKSQDLIMIDTAGRSHRNKEQILELKELLEQIQEKNVYLVMSCTSKDSDIEEIVKTYSFLKEYNIIFTKIDEAIMFGTILNTAKETKKTISYITTGQSVPDDIKKISTKKILNLLTKEVER